MASNKQKELAERIIRILGDDSSIPMLLIDGQWGSGKTFFAKNTLIPKIEETGTIVRYFSVYGVDSIIDFRDKFLSLSYTKHKDTGSAVSPILSAVSEITGNMGENGGVVASVINGFGNVIKKVAINNITNMTLVLDDLERIPDPELITNILGECFEYAENKRIKIIIICNHDKIDKKDAFEKVFSERIRYLTSEDEQIKIAFDEVTEKEKENIKRLLTKNNHENIRTLIKSAKKFKDIINSANFNKDNIDKTAARERLITNVIALCIGFYEKKLTIDEIVKIFSRNSLFDSPNEEQDSYLSTVKYLSKPPLDLIRHCCGMEISVEEIDFEDYLPKIKKGMETLIEYRMFLLSDEEFTSTVKELTDYLFNSTEHEKRVYEWFNALDIYIHLHINNYLEKSITEIKILETAEDYIKNEISFISMEQDDSYRVRLSTDGIKELYRSLTTKLDDKKTDSILNEIKNTFGRSWKEVNYTIKENYQTTPFLNQFDIDFIWNSMQKWSPLDICIFNRFINERYNSINIWDYLENEKDILKQLKNKLSSDITKMPNGLQRGYLTELSSTMSSLVNSF